MKYAKVRTMDISNGPGVRVSMFTQGCDHHCKNCFNQETWDICQGKEWTNEINDKIIKLMNKSHINGLSILGGDPFIWYEDSYYNTFIKNKSDMLLDLLYRTKMEYPDKTTWLWTGYLWESFYNNESNFSNRIMRILPYIDVIVDGLFIEDLKDLSLKYCGSTNQRVIDVQESLLKKDIILYK